MGRSAGGETLSGLSHSRCTAGVFFPPASRNGVNGSCRRVDLESVPQKRPLKCESLAPTDFAWLSRAPEFA